MAAHPNPFNPSTVLRAALPAPGHVELRIIDMAGRYVATLLDETLSAGELRVDWRPVGLPSGVYLAVLDAPAGRTGTRLTLLK